MKLASLSFPALSLLAVACTTEPQPDPIVVPDPQVFAAIYPTAARQVESPPFSFDLATCATARHVVATEQGDQFVLTHLGEDGHCQVWLGFDETAPAQIVHQDIYCALSPAGDANVALVSPDSGGGGGCGGPPGAPVLAVVNGGAGCVAIP